MATGDRDPWPLYYGEDQGVLIDQRDPRLNPSGDGNIAAYGCAMMCCFATGHWVAGRSFPTAARILQLHEICVRKGFIGDECYVQDWEKTINTAAGMAMVAYEGGHSPPDFPLDPGWIVFDVWKQPKYGKHFVWRHPIRYDPLSSASHGLSWSRKRGTKVGRRAFKVLEAANRGWLTT